MGYPWERVAIMGRIFSFLSFLEKKKEKEKWIWLLRANQKMMTKKKDGGYYTFLLFASYRETFK
jgi:hypothetical protein